MISQDFIILSYYKRIVRFSYCVGNNNIKNKDIIKVKLFVDSELSRFKILVEELESFILKKLILVDEDDE